MFRKTYCKYTFMQEVCKYNVQRTWLSPYYTETIYTAQQKFSMDTYRLILCVNKLFKVIKFLLKRWFDMCFS